MVIPKHTEHVTRGHARPVAGPTGRRRSSMHGGLLRTARAPRTPWRRKVSLTQYVVVAGWARMMALEPGLNASRVKLMEARMMELENSLISRL